MKKLYLTFLFFLCFLPFAFAQNIPYGMKYQAVARDLSGKILAEKEISLRISLVSHHTDQVAHYTEVHKITTNQFGLFSIVVGEGTVEKGLFTEIPWSTEDIWMQVDIKTAKSAEFLTISSSKLLAVPYAFHAGTANQLTNQNTVDGGKTPGVPAQNWSLFGNSNVDPTTDFLGATNYADLVMITNNLDRLRITKDGDINIANNLNVGNDVYIGNDLIVEKDVLLNKGGGATTNKGPFTVSETSPTTLTGTLHVNGATDLDNTLNVDGATDLNSSLNVNNASPTTLTGTLHTIGATDLDNTLNVDGATDLNGTLDVNNGSATNLSGTLHTVGATDLDNTLNVDGATDLNSTLIVDGTTNLNSSLTVNNAAPTNLSGILHVTGATDLDNTLNVDGASNLNSTLHVAGATDLDNNLNVDGTTDLNSTLSVDGATDLNSTLNTDGAATMGSSLTVAGATTLNNSLAANGQVTINAAVGSGDSNYDAYPLRVQGSDQGMAIKLNVGTPNNDNNFITFFNGSGNAVGRIEGETSGEATTDPEYIFDNSILAAEEAKAIANQIAAAIPVVVAGVGASAGPCGACIAMAAADLILATANLVAYNVFALENLGVTYQSGSADYAEWLERSNPAEKIAPADIVAVNGGKISKYTTGAQQFMVISTKPAVLGNMPPAGQESAYEKVAFMGQIPVKVRGIVFTGDYILPSGLNDGTGIAVSPKEIKADQYKLIVGVAWSESLIEGTVSRVNMAIGLNTNDLANLALEQENKIRLLESKFASLEARLIALEGGVPAKPATPAKAQEPAGTQPAKEQTKYEILAQNMPAELSNEVMTDAIANLKEVYTKQGISFKDHPGLNKLFTDASFQAEVIRKAQQKYKASYQTILENTKN